MIAKKILILSMFDKSTVKHMRLPISIFLTIHPGGGKKLIPLKKTAAERFRHTVFL